MKWWWKSGVVAGAAVALVIGGGVASAQTPSEPSAVDIAEEPENWIGRQVTVTDDVTDVLAPRAFQMGEEDVLGLFGGTELCVVGAQTLPQWVGDDFADSGFFDDDDDFAELEGRLPASAARSAGSTSPRSRASSAST